MAFSLNKVFLIGNLGKEPEHRTTNDGLNVAKYSLATSRRYKNKDGQWADETTWHNIVSWNLSDFLKGALKKGTKVCIEGRIQNRDYTDKEGVKRYTSEIITSEIILLEGRGSSQPIEENSRQETSYSGTEASIDTPPEGDLPF